MNINIPQIRKKLLELRNDKTTTERLFPVIDPGARELVPSNPYAFCIATCLDRGIKAEIIWTIPYWIKEKVNHFKIEKFYKMSLSEISDIFYNLPMRPRYINAAPRTFYEITHVIVEEFSGLSKNIWENKGAAEVKNTFLRIYGVGQGIANMALLLLESAYHFQFSDLDHSIMDIKPDVHTMRVLYRLGASDGENADSSMNAARIINPNYPGEIDASLWIIGQDFCRPRNPLCINCPLLDVCLQKIRE
jgi:endonuclease III